MIDNVASHRHRNRIFNVVWSVNWLICMRNWIKHASSIISCVAYKFEHSNATVIIVMLDFSKKEALNDDGSVHSLETTMLIMINLLSCILYGYLFLIILSKVNESYHHSLWNISRTFMFFFFFERRTFIIFWEKNFYIT